MHKVYVLYVVQSAVWLVVAVVVVCGTCVRDSACMCLRTRMHHVLHFCTTYDTNV